MAELILCKACQQGVFVLLADGQPRTVQHLETVAFEPQHLIHIQQDAPVADKEVFVGGKLLLHLGKGRCGPALTVVGHDPDDVVLGGRVVDLAQRDLHGLPRDPHIQLRFLPAQHPPQLGGQKRDLFLFIGLQ